MMPVCRLPAAGAAWRASLHWGLQFSARPWPACTFPECMWRCGLARPSRPRIAVAVGALLTALLPRLR